jgi:hypothetical protein
MFKRLYSALPVLLSLVLAACAPSISDRAVANTEDAPATRPPTPVAPAAGNSPGAKPGAAPTPVTLRAVGEATTGASYVIVDTGQMTCYDDRTEIACPSEGAAFYGQDAQYADARPSYRDNGDGTVSDLNTGLMWQQSPDFNGDGQIDYGDKKTYQVALRDAGTFTLAGYDDWRLPTIKELYSLIDFTGASGAGRAVPYIDTTYFEFAYGDASAGERDIDAQFASSTLYVSTVMSGQQAMFGVNFADGRIKGYGIDSTPHSAGGKAFYVLYVRGNTSYGINDFIDNGDGTITDRATGLTWLRSDSGAFNAGPYGDGSLNWGEALGWCEGLEYAGYGDWRLPNAKELQSIVDYTRSPDTTNSAAIDPLFQATLLPNGINNSGQPNYAYYWSSTTHLDGRVLGENGVYVAFGEARGHMDHGNGLQLLDVHGAGAQRSDPKSGDPSALPVGFGPQGDLRNVYDYARCVRGGAQPMEVVVSGAEKPPMESGEQPAVGQPPVGDGPGGSPPEEAIEACSGLNEGAQCEIASPRGAILGTCLPIQTELACVPEGGPPRGK